LLDLHNPNADPTLSPYPLEFGWDPGHSHEAFVQQQQGGNPLGMCVTSSCPNHSLLAYVASSSSPNPQAYLDLISRNAYANHVLQSNQGPSFIAHQYAIAGQSGGVLNWTGTSPYLLNPLAMDDNPAKPTDPANYDPSDPDPDANEGGGSCARTGRRVATVDMTVPYAATAHPTPWPAESPCNDYNTILDEMQAEYPTPETSRYEAWQYIANSTTTIWSGPMAVYHLYNDYNGDSDKSKEPFAADPDAQNFVIDANGGFSSRPFAFLTYITPCFHESDHPSGPPARGPWWLASVLNAIEDQGSDWNDTVVVVTWDDWGGWYDHFQPNSPNPVFPTPNAYQNSADPNEWGNRVPLIVVSKYVKSQGYISTQTRSQGAILNLIEQTFSLGPLGTDDIANAENVVTSETPDALQDMLNFEGLPIPVWTDMPTGGFTAPPSCD